MRSTRSSVRNVDVAEARSGMQPDVLCDLRRLRIGLLLAAGIGGGKALIAFEVEPRIGQLPDAPAGPQGPP